MNKYNKRKYNSALPDASIKFSKFSPNYFLYGL